MMKSILSLLVLLLCCSQWVIAQTKIAFVAGVERYDKSGLSNLEYAEDDARQVQTALKKLGFSVLPVIGEEASLANLNSSFDRFITQAKKLNKSDIVIVYLSGHGVQKVVQLKNTEGKTIEIEEPFFCPKDALKSDVSTLLSLNTMMKRLEDSSGSDHNIIMLDACRDSADKSGKGGIDGSTIRSLSDKLALFFAAKSGRRSFESKELQHGIFTHYLLEGLQGQAADSDDELTFQGLTNYVSKQVERNSPRLLEVSVADAQRPNFMGNLSGTIVLGKVDRVNPTTPPESSMYSELYRSKSLGLEMVRIPAGTFVMGSPSGEINRGQDETQHQVTLADDFYMGKFEVTQAEFETVMGFNPSKFRQSDQLPVENVTWYDAVMFCNKLSELDGYGKCYSISEIERDGDSIINANVQSLDGADGYNLPTEAQWEFACRANAKHYFPFSFGATITSAQVNYDGSSQLKSLTDSKQRQATLEVGKLPCNALGLFAMHGNVWEWCTDWYDKDYYSESPSKNPDGPETGSAKVNRGGSWNYGAEECRSAQRSANAEDYRSDDIGFRIVFQPK